MKLIFLLSILISNFSMHVLCAYIPVQNKSLSSGIVQKQILLKANRNLEEIQIDCISLPFVQDDMENFDVNSRRYSDETEDTSTFPVQQSSVISEFTMPCSSIAPMIVERDEVGDCILCKRNPMKPWHKIRQSYAKASPSKQQKIAIGTGLGLVTAGALATPAMDVPAKRDLQEGKTILIKIDDETDSSYRFNRESEEAVPLRLLCAYNQRENSISKRGQFLQNAGMAAMFGGMIITPAVSTIKSRVGKKKDGSQGSSASIAKRSYFDDQTIFDTSNISQENIDRFDCKFAKRGRGLDFLNTASMAGMLGGTVIMPGIAAVKTQMNKGKQASQIRSPAKRSMNLYGEEVKQESEDPTLKSTHANGHFMKPLAAATEERGILQKRNPEPGLLKGAFKAIPTLMGTAGEIKGVVKGHKKRSLSDDDDAAPVLEKRLGKKGWGKALSGLNSAGTAAMVGSTGLAAHGALKDGWNAKKNQAAAAPVRKRDLKIEISGDEVEEEKVIIIKRQPTRGRNGGRARGSAGSAGSRSKPKTSAKPAAQPQPQAKMGKGEKAMAGLGAAMSAGMIVSFAGEAKQAMSKTPAEGQAVKRDNARKRGANDGFSENEVGSIMIKRAPLRFKQKKSIAVRTKPSPQPTKGKSSASSKAMGALGAATSVGSVVGLAGEAKAAMAKPPAGGQPQKRAITPWLKKRAPRPIKIGNAKPRPGPSNGKPTSTASGSGGGGGGGKMSKGLETAGTVSMVAGMATPVLTPVASAARNGWDKVKGAFGRKKKP